MKWSAHAALVLSLYAASCSSDAPRPGTAESGRAGSAGAATATSSAGTVNAGAGGAGASGEASIAGRAAGGAIAAGGTSNAGSSGVSNAGSSGVSNAGSSGVITVPAGHRLVWHDEFDTDGAPNPADWKFETGFVRNEEAQWYQADNARVESGLLLIEARKESLPNPNYTGTGDWKTTRKTAQYSSSSLNTSGLRSFQYGHFELRARIPTAAGMWPAWWTLGVSGEWPSNGEIDIMEFYQNQVLANVACGTNTRYQAKWSSMAKALGSLGAGWASNFHIWTMDWDAERIVLSLDGEALNTTPLRRMLNADGTSPFEQKAYLLLNLAIGGLNGGSPAETPFPQRFEVDYVRVFQKN